MVGENPATLLHRETVSLQWKTKLLYVEKISLSQGLVARIFRRGISIEYENTTESASANKYLSAFRCICNHCPAERKRSTSKPGLVIQSAKCFRRS